jgi:ribose/xylose/arabinose/galactoside ABC-type transport system permease subunit
MSRSDMRPHRSRTSMVRVHRRELPIGLVIVALGVVLAAIAPGYFSTRNLTDLFLANMPVLLVSLGMTLVILTGEIDISIGSTFAICGVAAGVLAKADWPVTVAALGACFVGCLIGLLNGALVAFVRIPSIVVTLATMTALRDGLRWTTEGAWVEDLPPSFQWFGLTQSAFPIVAATAAAALFGVSAWLLGNTAAGRAIYATGSNPDGARLVGLRTGRIKLVAFATLGALTGAAAIVNAVRFNQIPSNAGVGLEMKVIASVVVGGAAITGGRGTAVGTLLGVVLLGAIGPALTFLGVNASWERAIQGAIILAAVAADSVRRHVRPAVAAV